LRKLDGRIIAALNISVHSERMPLKAVHSHFFPRLHALADELQRHLIWCAADPDSAKGGCYRGCSLL
jgi:DNA-binding IclR family transcriptional regulator